MDDCCRIMELVLGARPATPVPFTEGFLEIVSTVELTVTAVYTVSDRKNRSISMEVETIQARPIM